VRLSDAERVSRAIQTLSGGASLDAVVDRLYDLTEGTLALDRATLHRIARGKTRVARAIDTPAECIRLYFAGFIGEPLAELIFRDLETTLPKLVDRLTLKEYLEEGLRIWLPK